MKHLLIAIFLIVNSTLAYTNCNTVTNEKSTKGHTYAIKCNEIDSINLLVVDSFVYDSSATTLDKRNIVEGVIDKYEYQLFSTRWGYIIYENYMKYEMYNSRVIRRGQRITQYTTIKDTTYYQDTIVIGNTEVTISGIEMNSDDKEKVIRDSLYYYKDGMYIKHVGRRTIPYAIRDGMELSIYKDFTKTAPVGSKIKPSIIKTICKVGMITCINEYSKEWH